MRRVAFLLFITSGSLVLLAYVFWGEGDTAVRPWVSVCVSVYWGGGIGAVGGWLGQGGFSKWPLSES